MKQRVIWGAIALLIMLPFLLHGGWCGRNVTYETS